MYHTCNFEFLPRKQYLTRPACDPQLRIHFRPLHEAIDASSLGYPQQENPRHGTPMALVSCLPNFCILSLKILTRHHCLQAYLPADLGVMWCFPFCIEMSESTHAMVHLLSALSLQYPNLGPISRACPSTTSKIVLMPMLLMSWLRHGISKTFASSVQQPTTEMNHFANQILKKTI